MPFTVTVTIGVEPELIVGGEVMAPPISASGPEILLLVAVAIAIAVPFLSRRIAIRILRT